MLNVKGIDIEDDEDVRGVELRPSEYANNKKTKKKCC